MKQVAHAMLLALVVTGCAESPAQPSIVTTSLASANEGTAQVNPMPRASSPQRADTIKLRDGYVEVGDRLSAMLRGTSGFSTETLVLYRTGIVPSDHCNFSPNECRPGATLPLRGVWTVPDISGNVRLQGRTYQLGVNATQCNGMGIELSGSYGLPAEAAAATITAPFTLSGWIDCGDGQLGLEGTGTVTIDLTWSAASTAWHVKTLRFEIR